MTLRHALLALSAAALLAIPPIAEASPRGGDRDGAQKSSHRGHDRAHRSSRSHDRKARTAPRHVERGIRSQGDRFRHARRTIRHRTVERASERHHRRHYDKPIYEHRRRVLRPNHRERDYRHRDRSKSRVYVDFRIGGDYCPPPVVKKKVVIERPYVRRTHRVVEHRRPVYVERRTERYVDDRPTYVEYEGDAWSDLARGRHRAALDSFGIIASSRPYDAQPKIGYALAAAGLGDHTVAATAFRRALKADAHIFKAFRGTPAIVSQLRDLEYRYERTTRENMYDTDAVFLLASVRTLLGATITQHDLDTTYQMLAAKDRELLGLDYSVSENSVGMYDD